MTEVTIRQVAGRADTGAFLAAPARLASLGWGVPLRWDEARFIDPTSNGFFRTHELACFLAFHDGELVGRIAACVPQGAAAPATFGLLCATPDAVPALVNAARGWIAARGRSGMLGPLSFTINHEVGAQIGFHDRPRMLRMPRTPPWLPAALDGKRGDEARLPARAVNMLGRPGAGSFEPTLWSTLMTTRRAAAIAG